MTSTGMDNTFGVLKIEWLMDQFYMLLLVLINILIYMMKKSLIPLLIIIKFSALFFQLTKKMTKMEFQECYGVDIQVTIMLEEIHGNYWVVLLLNITTNVLWISKWEKIMLLQLNLYLKFILEKQMETNFINWKRWFYCSRISWSLNSSWRCCYD